MRSLVVDVCLLLYETSPQTLLPFFGDPERPSNFDEVDFCTGTCRDGVTRCSRIRKGATAVRPAALMADQPLFSRAVNIVSVGGLSPYEQVESASVLENSCVRGMVCSRRHWLEVVGLQEKSIN